MKDPEAVSRSFEALIGDSPKGLWAAPGRVNLIGEHTDYNGGFVLPFALQFGVVCAARTRSDQRLVVRSAQMPDGATDVDLTTVSPGDTEGWAGYAVGPAWALRSAGYPVPGCDLLLDGDVPLGAGLSSSAAVECAVVLALRDLAGLSLTHMQLTELAHKAENDFVGAPTGVMDQMASMHGLVGHATLIDTRSLTVDPVPLDLARWGLALLVIDTRTSHTLVESEYAARRMECEMAAELLKVEALRDVGPDDMIGKASWSALPDVLQRRVRHVVTENARVLEVAAALRAGDDPRAIGDAMTRSHISLRDDFQVTVPQLDVAVEAALLAGAHGARMTGGGFGGSVLALVTASEAADVETAVRREFSRRGFAEPSIFEAVPSSGASRIA